MRCQFDIVLQICSRQDSRSCSDDEDVSFIPNKCLDLVASKHIFNAQVHIAVVIYLMPFCSRFYNHCAAQWVLKFLGMMIKRKSLRVLLISQKSSPLAVIRLLLLVSFYLHSQDLALHLHLPLETLLNQNPAVLPLPTHHSESGLCSSRVQPGNLASRVLSTTLHPHAGHQQQSSVGHPRDLC